MGKQQGLADWSIQIESGKQNKTIFFNSLKRPSRGKSVWQWLGRNIPTGGAATSRSGRKRCYECIRW